MTTVRRPSRSYHDLKKKYGSRLIGVGQGQSRAFWQLMVLTTTTLRWYYVLYAATQLLLRCYTDYSRPSTEFIAFTVRLYYDIQDHTTTLRSPRRLYNDTTTVVLIILGFYYASRMIKRWCAYLLGFWNVFYFILRHEKRISDYLFVTVFVSTKNKFKWKLSLRNYFFIIYREV